MGLILNIETSSPVCSVCIANNGSLVDFREDRQGNSHARILTVLIDELMHENKFSYNQLDGIAVSAGPGSYTGLRIGTSVAKGLCYVLNKPLIAVPTLQALCEGIKEVSNNKKAYYMPVIDARRLDVYMAVFDNDAHELTKTQAITINEALEDDLNKYDTVYLGGNAIEKCKNIFTSNHIHFIDGIDCDSRLMVKISEIKYKHAQFENLSYFEPVYLKEFGNKG